MQREELHAARAPGLRAPRARSAAAAAAASRRGPGGLAAPLAAAALLCLARGAAAAGLAFDAGTPATLALAALRPDAAKATVSFENTVRRRLSRESDLLGEGEVLAAQSLITRSVSVAGWESLEH